MVEKIKQALERAYQERKDNFEISSAQHNPLEPDVAEKNIYSDKQQTRSGEVSTRPTADLLSTAQTYEITTKHLSLNRIITYDDSDSNIESYRLLRTQFIRKMKSDDLVTLGITSSNAGEGKSLTAVNLALSLAKSSELEVILIDGDIARPTVHKLLGIDTEWGLIDVIKETVELGSVILKLNIPNLWVIPGRFERLSLLDQTSSSRIDSLISSIVNAPGRVVIVDLPPVLAKDDTLAIAMHLDAIILIVEEDSTRTKELTRSVELLEPCNLIGTVLNKYSGKQDTYY